MINLSKIQFHFENGEYVNVCTFDVIKLYLNISSLYTKTTLTHKDIVPKLTCENFGIWIYGERASDNYIYSGSSPVPSEHKFFKRALAYQDILYIDLYNEREIRSIRVDYDGGESGLEDNPSQKSFLNSVGDLIITISKSEEFVKEFISNAEQNLDKIKKYYND